MPQAAKQHSASVIINAGDGDVLQALVVCGTPQQRWSSVLKGSEPDQYQVLCVVLIGCLCFPGLRLPSSSLAEKFPEGLARRAEHVWRASVHPVARTSKLQDDVSAVLWSLGVAHKNNDVTADGLFCVDIAVDGGKV